MSEAATIERVLRHDRTIVGAGLAFVAGLAWIYTIAGAYFLETDVGMEGVGAMAMAPAPWSVGHAAMIALMWIVMMIRADREAGGTWRRDQPRHGPSAHSIRDRLARGSSVSRSVRFAPGGLSS